MLTCADAARSDQRDLLGSRSTSVHAGDSTSTVTRDAGGHGPAVQPSRRRLDPVDERCGTGDGHRDRVRHLGARPAARERDAGQQPGRERLRAARSRGAGRARWDFEEESPLRDARGFDLSPRRRPTPASSPTRTSGLANVILTNGARLYVDHAHPEYSSPEVHQPARRRALGQGRGARHGCGAGRLAQLPGERDRAALQEQHRQQGRVLRHPRELPDAAVHAVRRHRPAPDAVLRHPPGRHAAPAGSASARTARGDGFQLSQRADFFEVEVGLETTLKRPIINTRDEPHADPEKYRRLHVIIGDANLAEVSTYLKVGTTSLVLAMIEDRVLDRPGWDLGLDGAGARPCGRSRTTRRSSTSSSCGTAGC